ncbi:MAG: hypothetical protein AAB414_03070 [Patescibacteria group bacterium]
MERFKEEAHRVLKTLGIVRFTKEVTQHEPEVIKPNEVIRVKHSRSKKEILFATGAGLFIGGIAGIIFQRSKRPR